MMKNQCDRRRVVTTTGRNRSFSVVILVAIVVRLTKHSCKSLNVDTDNTISKQQHQQQHQRQHRTNTLPIDLLPSSVDVVVDIDIENNNHQEVFDPALQWMTYDIGNGQQKVLVYVEPSLDVMYQNLPKNKIPSLTKVTPQFKGFASKIINLSNQNLTLYWEDGEKVLHEIDHPGPFSAYGSGTFYGHRFVYCKENDPNTILHEINVQEYPNNMYYYDPYHSNDNNTTETEYKIQSLLSKKERTMYKQWYETIEFNKQYQQYTGRSYLANYLRSRPIHFMWPGTYFGQQQWVMTRETQYTIMPSDIELQPLPNEYDIVETNTETDEYILLPSDTRRLQPNQSRLLQQYRNTSQNGLLNMTLTTISVAPRVFRIDNFLSPIEIEHILNVAAESELSISLTGDNMYDKFVNTTTNSRTSYNTWVNRNKSPIIDTIYRRAADLLRIDESLFRPRYYENDDYANIIHSTEAISEELQLVHYEDYQEYDAHHDFMYSDYHNNDNTNKYQGARFATLLLYLNEDMVGGETSFPRWVNGETFKQLKVRPITGQAILFYNQLPDGNLDDFSQHASLPVIEGEKLINLWVWDPLME